MCGRYYSDEANIEIQKILRCIKYSSNDQVIKTGEIYPGNTVAIITSGIDNNQPQITPAKWGIQLENNKNLIINGRAETALSKKIFSNLLLKNRCCIPATGFYEWTSDESKKKYIFSNTNEHILYLTGLFLINKSEKQFIILTTDANKSVKPIHNRMPLMVDHNQVREWINNYNFANHHLQEKMPILNCEEAV